MSLNVSLAARRPNVSLAVVSLAGLQTNVWQNSDTRALLFTYFLEGFLTILRAIKDFGSFQIKIWPSVGLFIT
jgi:hypothetical protein